MYVWAFPLEGRPAALDLRRKVLPSRKLLSLPLLNPCKATGLDEKAEVNPISFTVLLSRNISLIAYSLQI